MSNEPNDRAGKRVVLKVEGPCHTHKGCTLREGDQDYKHVCGVCGAKPTVHPTDLCGPCCTGEGETANGNW